MLVLSIIGIVLACEHLIPLLIVRQDPERVLDVLLPSFDAIARRAQTAHVRAAAARHQPPPPRIMSGVRTDAHVAQAPPPVEVTATMPAA